MTKNVITIKQVYNVRYVYKRSQIEYRTKLRHIVMLLESDNYIH